MKLLSKTIVLLFISLFCFTSCGDEPIGKWPKMKWKNIDNLTLINGAYIIPEEGGTFTFECTNYHIWLCSVVINGERQIITSDNYYDYKNDWFEVRIVEKNIFFTFDKIDETTNSRIVDVDVTGGDIFDYFYFNQQKVSVE